MALIPLERICHAWERWDGSPTSRHAVVAYCDMLDEVADHIGASAVYLRREILVQWRLTGHRPTAMRAAVKALNGNVDPWPPTDPG